ncbi:MAG: YigZ family protein [Muribaculaceae bacterium]|nr:YigZ family protein [Muribaculaceae bacterium]
MPGSATHSSEYLTLAAPAKAQMREKMSRFIAFAYPVSSPEQARSHMATLTREYHDARHICWAYMIGADGAVTYSTDAGEPSGTAGKPILGQIRSAGLTYVMVAVVRYFGGIKLGTSGLIAAYREAARLVLEEAEKTTRFETAQVSFRFPYLSMNQVMRVVKESGAEIAEQEFDNSCLMTLTTRADRAEALSDKISAIDGVTLNEL